MEHRTIVRTTWLYLAAALLLLPAPHPASGRRARRARMTLQRGAREPAAGRRAPSARTVARLRKAVAAAPRDRGRRLALVMALIRAGALQQALKEARAWRRHDAYNLVVVRLIGDIHTELKRPRDALRAYSAVVELLPGDAGAQRALAAVFKQAGQLGPAYQRLRAAHRLRREDARVGFELAAVAQRLGRSAEAERRFAAIIASAATPEKVRYPAKQRLMQLYARRRRAALAAGEAPLARQLDRAIAKLGVKGGVKNDIKVYLSWDVDRADIDLWVVNPAGEKIYYQHKRGRFGGALYDDVTSGYGPESFTARRARRGTYAIKVHYYGTRRRVFTEARGEVLVVLAEGTPRERRFSLPYRLFRPKQLVTVARVRVR